MAVELSDYTATLSRAVTPLGGTLGSTITSSVLTGYLADAFWEARLDGFLKGFTADEDGIVEPVDATGTVDDTLPDITRDRIAIVVLYAAIGILSRQVLNTQTQFRAKAGPVEYEQQSSATMLAEMLKQLQEQRKRLIELAVNEDADRDTILMRDVVVDRLGGLPAYALSI